MRNRAPSMSVRSTLQEIHVVGDKFYLGDSPPVQVRLYANTNGQVLVKAVQFDTSVDQEPRRAVSHRVAMAGIDQA